jgi:hypothetical protein
MKPRLLKPQFDRSDDDGVFGGSGSEEEKHPSPPKTKGKDTKPT